MRRAETMNRLRALQLIEPAGRFANDPACSFLASLR